MTHIQRWQPKKHSHWYFVDQRTIEAVCQCTKVRGSKKAPPGKFRAMTTRYDGYHYDSILEANYAMQLDWRLKAGEIKGWAKQVSIPNRCEWLPHPDNKGRFSRV